jgi:alkanesulfonate monooxygenase SsuD/methylene tetrahydromethanopterin reductase-like flavin-dependent oxidoreductase (luciferase family)
MFKAADELGFYAAYSVDETYWKDMWLLFAAAADKTKNIRMGPSVTHVILKDPTILAQQIATLDELSNGRAEAVISFGNLAMLGQYHVKWQGSRPIARVKEAYHVMRTFLDSGIITYEGEFFNYTGLFTLARPAQKKLPIKMGAMGGPRSFQIAGQFFDGIHHALGYSRENYDYVMENVKAGAKKAGRNWQDLDLAAWVVWVVSNDSRAAKETARIMVAFYLGAMPPSQVERHGMKYSDLQPIFDAFGAGDVQKAVDLTSAEIGEKLSISGTPEECVAKLKKDILPTGINHVVAAITDPYLVAAFTGRKIENCPDVIGQMKLIHDRVMPALK